MDAVLVGIDLGQGAVKVTALDADGKVLATTAEEYPTAHPQPGWSEQDPHLWVEATARACHQVTERLQSVSGSIRVDAIGLTAATHHSVLLDAQDEPVRPCIMLTDARSAAEARELMAAHGEEVLQRARNVATAGWTLPQLLWLARHEPERWARVRRLVFAKDYLRWVLTGVWATDWIDAEGSLLYAAAARHWDPVLCALAGVPPVWLPDALEPTVVSGALSAHGARLLGLHEGTPVVAGCSDTAAEAVAAGACEPGQVVLKLATAGNVNVITDTPRPAPSWFTYTHPVPGLSYHALGTNAAAASLRWLRDALGAGTLSYAALDAEAALVAAGAEGLLFHPYLLGERAPYWDPALRASFVGLQASHTRGHLVRAVLEGVALSLADCLAVLRRNGVRVEAARIVGGGARSALWRQIVSDVLGLPLLYPALSDASAGAALLAGVGIGVYASVQDAAVRTLCVEAEHVPDERRHAGYRELLAAYQRVQQLVAPVGPALERIRYE